MAHRYNKIVEFAAHAGDVRCVRVGRKTAGVLVTGGDDKKVNVWAIGKTTASFTLTGHQSSVESVAFDKDEVVVAAGGSNGSIKLFELQIGKVTRSLNGHKSNVICLEWHPYETTIISGSMDTNVKLWNLNDKEAITTFKGHNAGVTHVKFSPDGNWVASASQDGAVKIWDVRAGKLMQDLVQPAGRANNEVTGLEFSPTEYLLATSARDKVVRFWDLETFHPLGNTSPEATPVRNIAFHPDGNCIFSAVQDGCRVWSVEPPEQQDYVSVPWSCVSDLCVSHIRGQQRLVGCSFHSTMVGLFYITLRNVRPFAEDPEFMAKEQGASVDGNPYAGARSSAAAAAAASSSHSAGGAGGYAGRSSSQPSGSSSQAYGGAAAVGAVEAGMRRMGLGDRAGSVPDDRAARSGRSGVGAVESPPGYTYDGGASGGRPAERQPSAGRAPPPSGLPPQQPVAVSLYGQQHGGASSSRYAGAGQDYGPGDSVGSEVAVARMASGSSAGPRGVSVGVGVGDSLLRGQAVGPGLGSDLGPLAAPPPALPRPRPQAPRDPGVEVHVPAGYPSARPPRQPDADPYAPSGADPRYYGQGAGAGPSGAGMYPDERRGRPAGAGAGGYGDGGAVYASGVPGDLDAARALALNHSTIVSTLKKRANTLQMARGFVVKGEWRNAVGAARRCEDPAALADILSVLVERNDFKLESVAEVMPAVDSVLSLPADRQVMVGLDIVSTFYSCFGHLIRDALSAPARGLIDISFEERRDRAAKAKAALLTIVPKLSNLSLRSDSVGLRAKDLAAQVMQLN